VTTATTKTTGGVLLPGATYTLPAFMHATGLSRSALREMRRQGFRVCRVSKRAFVLADDFARFLSEAAES
jgi:hypothetical protein